MYILRIYIHIYIYIYIHIPKTSYHVFFGEILISGISHLYTHTNTHIHTYTHTHRYFSYICCLSSPRTCFWATIV